MKLDGLPQDFTVGGGEAYFMAQLRKYGICRMEPSRNLNLGRNCQLEEFRNIRVGDMVDQGCWRDERNGFVERDNEVRVGP